jgi:YD repeat-containing protein
MSKITLTWTASTDDVKVTGYLVESCSGVGCTNFVQVATPNGTTYNNTGLTPTTSYSYRVRATDAAGNLSNYSTVVSATTPTDTQAPTIPTGLSTVSQSSLITLFWAASKDNVGVTGYLVERCQGNNCSTFSQIATSATTTYIDVGLSPSTNYSYRVRAMDAAGNLSGYVSIATFTLSDTEPPTAPTNISATATSPTQINLNWGASTDDVGVTAYLIERCQGVGCLGFTQIASTGGLSYSDMNLVPESSYTYRVRATDAANNLSDYSSNVSAETQSASVTFSYSYDALGRVIRESGSDGSTIDYQYDSNGNVTAISRH